jgi:peptidoglycan hydrolase CwlO-like protein
MKILIAMFCIILSTAGIAQNKKDYGYLKAEDQKYFKNAIMEGSNAVERVDKNVKAINDIYGKMEAMEKEIAQLKSEIAQLKASKPTK